MLNITKILVPVDFSEPSKTAVNYGLSLALQFNAGLVLAHIVPSSLVSAYTFPTESFAFEKDQAESAKTTLPTLVPAECRERVRLGTIVKVGDVRSELLGMIHDENPDLLVMGTHGRNVFERFLLGSLTERMLRKVSVPILTVSHLAPTRELHTIGPVPLRHVLYATDLSAGAESGLRFSAELARGAVARLSVVHVFKSLDRIYWAAEAGYIGDEILSMKEDAERRLHSSIPSDLPTTLQVEPVMLDGEAYREILNFADEQNVDIIVMNMQSKTALERAMLGSTAERVIRGAHVPVLSIPIAADDGAKNVAA